MKTDQIIEKLDFWKGKKTAFSSFFTLLVVIGNIFGYQGLDAKELTEVTVDILSELEVIVGAVGIIYGLVMKKVRTVKKK